MIYFPSKSVVAPFVVPFITTLAKGSGSLLTSLSLKTPSIVPVCPQTIAENIKMTTLKKLFIYIFIYRCKDVVKE